MLKIVGFGPQSQHKRAFRMARNCHVGGTAPDCIGLSCLRRSPPGAPRSDPSANRHRWIYATAAAQHMRGSAQTHQFVQSRPDRTLSEGAARDARDAPGCPGMPRDSPGCPGMPRDAPGCTGMHRDARDATGCHGMPRDATGCPVMLGDGRRCLRVGGTCHLVLEAVVMRWTHRLSRETS